MEFSIQFHPQMYEKTIKDDFIFSKLKDNGLFWRKI